MSAYLRFVYIYASTRYINNSSFLSDLEKKNEYQEKSESIQNGNVFTFKVAYRFPNKQCPATYRHFKQTFIDECRASS